MTLARLWRWFWRRPDASAAPQPPLGDGRAVSRARFWNELRAGQREAEARSARGQATK